MKPGKMAGLRISASCQAGTMQHSLNCCNKLEKGVLLWVETIDFCSNEAL